MTIGLSFVDAPPVMPHVAGTVTELGAELNGRVRVERRSNLSETWVPVDDLNMVNRDGLSLTGASGDYASTPDAASLDIIGDIDLRADATLNSWESGSPQVIVSKYDASSDQRSYRLNVTGGRRLNLITSDDGVAQIVNEDSTVPVTPGAGGRLAIRATLDVDSGDTGLVLTGTSGDYVSTPDSASLDIVGDIDLRAEASLTSWTSPPDDQSLVTKWTTTGDERSYILRIDTDGTVRLGWSTDGTSGGSLAALSTVPITASSNDRLAVRATLDVDDGGGGWTATFYTASSIAGPWEQLGATVDNGGGGTTSINAGTSIVEIGSEDVGTNNLTEGIFYAVEVRDGIDGTVVANPDFTAESPGTTSFDDAAGNTWTVNGDAEITSNHVVTFYTAPSIVGPWARLGAAITNVGTTSIFSGSADLTVGAGDDNGTASPAAGIVHAAEVYDGIDGSLVADPLFAGEAAETTNFIDSSGNTWTVNGNAEITASTWTEFQDFDFIYNVTQWYRLTRVDPGPGLQLPGGNTLDFASTPDAVSLDIAGDFEIGAEFTADFTAGDTLLSKWTATDDERSFFLQSHNGRIRLRWTTDGTAVTEQVVDSDPLPFDRADRLTVLATLDVDNGSNAFEVRFFYGTQGIDGPLTQLGNSVLGLATTSVYSGTADLLVGAHDEGATGAFPGAIHTTVLRSGLGSSATTVADPNFGLEATGTTSFDDGAGNTWTVNGGAVIYSELIDGPESIELMLSVLCSLWDLHYYEGTPESVVP